MDNAQLPKAESRNSKIAAWREVVFLCLLLVTCLPSLLFAQQPTPQPYAIKARQIQSSGELDLFAGGTNQNITLTPSGTGSVLEELSSGARALAGEPLASDAIQHVSLNGNDSNDGLSWGAAKATIAGALGALPSCTDQAGNASAHCGRIVVGVGTFAPSATLVLPSAVTLVGISRSQSILTPPSTMTGPVIQAGVGGTTQSSGVHVRNLTVICSSQANQSGILLANTSYYGSIRDVNVTGCNNGIFTPGTDYRPFNWSIEDSRIVNNTTGVSLPLANNIRLLSNEIDNNGVGLYLDADAEVSVFGGDIEFNTSYNIEVNTALGPEYQFSIQGVYFEPNAVATSRDIYFHQANATPAHEVLSADIGGCYFEGNGTSSTPYSVQFDNGVLVQANFHGNHWGGYYTNDIENGTGNTFLASGNYTDVALASSTAGVIQINPNAGGQTALLVDTGAGASNYGLDLKAATANEYRVEVAAAAFQIYDVTTGKSVMSVNSADDVSFPNGISVGTHASVAQTNAAVPTTTLIPAATLGGVGRIVTVALYAYDLGAGAGCTGNTTVTWTISYDDPSGSVQTQTLTQTITGNGGVTSEFTSRLFVLDVSAGANLTYSTSYTAGTGCTTDPGYAADLKAIY